MSTTELKPELKPQEKVAEIDDLPPLEETTAQTVPETSVQGEGKDEDKSSRSEKKSRKAMAKLGLKEFSGVKVVQIKQKGTLITIQNPEVYKSGGDTFVVYGVPQMEEMGKKYQQALQQLSGNGALAEQLKAATKKTVVPTKSVEPEGVADESGIDAKDVELILKQVEGCSRSKAIEALRQNNGDLVNAIMSLTGV